MSALDDLSPDQRAVLQLLLKQDKSYAELAAMLRIDPASVRTRATAALATLGPPLDEADCAVLTDWLLGQQAAADLPLTHALLAESPAAYDWAAEVGTALREAGLEPRAEPPAFEDEGLGSEPVADPEPEPEPTPAPTPEPVGFGPRDDDGPKPSRLGGVLVIAGVLIVVAVILVVVFTRGDDDGDDSASVGTTAAQTATETTPSTTPTAPTGQITPEAQVNMSATGEARGAAGVAIFFTDGVDRGVEVRAEKLPANTADDSYALWLADGPDGSASLLGFSRTKVDESGDFAGSIALPENADDFRRIELTRETTADPQEPGTVLLRGPIE